MYSILVCVFFCGIFFFWWVWDVVKVFTFFFLVIRLVMFFPKVLNHQMVVVLWVWSDLLFINSRKIQGFPFIKTLHCWWKKGCLPHESDESVWSRLWYASLSPGATSSAGVKKNISISNSSVIAEHLPVLGSGVICVFGLKKGILREETKEITHPPETVVSDGVKN